MVSVDLAALAAMSMTARCPPSREERSFSPAPRVIVLLTKSRNVSILPYTPDTTTIPIAPPIDERRDAANTEPGV